MALLSGQQRVLLHWLGHFYLRQGQPKRALVLLMLAAREASSDDEGLLPAVVVAMVENGMPKRAEEVLSWIPGGLDSDDPALLLLRARVHWLAGERAEARRLFQAFAAARHRAHEHAPAGETDGED